MFPPVDFMFPCQSFLFFGVTDLFLITSEYFKGTGKASLVNEISQGGERSLLCFIMGKFARLLSRSRKGPLYKISLRYLFQERESLY